MDCIVHGVAKSQAQLSKLFLAALVFVAVHGLSLVAVSTGYSPVMVCGLLMWWLLFLWSTGSRACEPQ